MCRRAEGREGGKGGGGKDTRKDDIRGTRWDCVLLDWNCVAV